MVVEYSSVCDVCPIAYLYYLSCSDGTSVGDSMRQLLVEWLRSDIGVLSRVALGGGGTDIDFLAGGKSLALSGELSDPSGLPSGCAGGSSGCDSGGVDCSGSGDGFRCSGDAGSSCGLARDVGAVSGDDTGDAGSVGRLGGATCAARSCRGDGDDRPDVSQVKAGVRRARNKRKREARRLRKQGLCEVEDSVPEWRRGAGPGKLPKLARYDSSLHESSVAKWKAQNDLAAERARRELEVLKHNDVSGEVKRYRAKVTAATERQLVSIEKTHAQLAAAGNVPVDSGEMGFAETVAPSLSTGTISPNSSMSVAEFWAVKKRNDELEEMLRLMHEKTGVNPEHLKLCGKEIWTDNSENEAILDEFYPSGYGKDNTYTEEGKFRVC